MERHVGRGSRSILSPESTGGEGGGRLTADVVFHAAFWFNIAITRAMLRYPCYPVVADVTDSEYAFDAGTTPRRPRQSAC